MSWPLVKISDFCQTGSGGTPSRDIPEYYEGDIPWIKSGDLKENIVTSATEFISREAIKKSSAKIVSQGAILVAMYGATVGRMALLGIDAATNQAVCNVVPDASKADTKYVYYALLSKVPDFLRSAIGGAQPNISQGLIRSTEIPLPPLPEQKRIAAILDKADAIRRKRQQSSQLADDFLRAVFLDMFGDPVTNPKGWSVKPLSAGIRSISSGWSASGENRPCGAGEKGVLKISAVTSGVFKPEENKAVPIDQIPDGKKLLFPKRGDLLFSRANTRELVAASCIVMTDAEDVFLPDKLWLVETDQNKLLPEFLNYLLWQPRFKERLTSQATGTSGSMLNISKSKFEETDAFFPNMELQGKFKRIYWALQETLDASASSREAGDSLFESLSQKAFSGHL